jgi:transposase-like protein
VQLILEPGASVAEVPRAHGVNANQMFAWRRAFERDELTQPCSALLLASASFVRDAGYTATCQWHSRSDRVNECVGLMAPTDKPSDSCLRTVELN